MILPKIKAIYYFVEFIISVVLVVLFMWIFKNNMHKVRCIWAKTQRILGFYKVEIIGKAKDANMIIVNHKSMLDIVVLEEVYPKNLCWIAKKEIGKLPIIGKIMTLPKMIPVDRESPRAIINLLKEVKDRLKDDRVIAIFPEGTRAKGNKLLKFQNGAKVLAEKLNLKIQPVVVVGSDILDVKNFTFKNGIIKIVYMDLVDTTKPDWYEDTRRKMQEILDQNRNVN
ncbi:1-acylglycerol-3-phosphate O-acyltransferase [Campylobacter pinnipediorum subsp. caledonicus]|uniref:1-acyl-sn-glycerol-3-phosphate acyltransferase n=1 Tax=Campylobacter pinnipediorum subsp. caledonicus TaxID=1874362 RepID=A0A1S6U7H7_9BACT|nr:lysophospholipid acyltransferase family protein [Campylobacter pinnipediorum]AQW87639.1 1-acylglycerol-3-phosphate O-acyltransferase [Campylobacter pinnipediorum subsp. caledonicus]OPA72229.1 acyl-phosphate glycerol 3-phosphate acyltransferase [Campylobacter pinnipediorum subsp. caledonicus]